MANNMYRVKFPDNTIREVPDYDLDRAISLNGVVVDDGLVMNQEPNPQQNDIASQMNTSSTPKMLKMRFPDNSIREVPEKDQKRAESLGAKIDDSWGKFAARTAKSAVAGIGGGTIDAITAAYNIPAALENAKTPQMRSVSQAMHEMNPFPREVEIEATELPLIPSATEAIDNGIDQATGDYTRTPEQEKWFQEGIKFASSVGTGGALGALASKAGKKGVESALKFTGSTKPGAIIGGAASGAASQKAHELGANTPESIGAGIGAGIIADIGANILKPSNIKRTATRVAGFGKNNLNVEAIESANKLNIGLPGIAATEGTLPAHVHAHLNKIPGFGDKLREKIQTASKQFQKSWEDMLDTVGISKSEEVSQANSRNYDLMRESIPDNAHVDPSPIIESISKVENELKTAVHSDPTKKLFSIMGEFKKALSSGKPKLPAEFEKYPPHVQEQILNALPMEVNPISVKELVRQKIELNKIMRDRNIFDRVDTDSLSFLHKLKEGVDVTLENYGATNPKFKKALERADEAFAKTAKRENLDDLLAGKIVDPNTGEVSYNSLVRTLSDRSKQKFLKNNLGEANYKKLEDFVNVAKAMESVKRGNPNPSGTATMGAATGLLYLIANGNLAIPAATIAGGGIATSLLTNNKFLNVATRYAKEPTEVLAKQLEGIVKESTGMSIQTLQKHIRDNQINQDQKEE